MPYVIAEIGFNHEGDVDKAREMIRAAAQAGANAVKFQTFKAIDLALPSAPHYAAIKSGEMSLEQHRELFRVATECGIRFMSTPFSTWAVDLLELVGVTAYKVASMDCTNRHLLGYIAKTGKPIYLSTGMATLSEIAESLEFLKKERSGPVTLLHCISMYPPEAEQLNLDVIPFLKKSFGLPVGYSDHYPGTKACLAAAVWGADVIETHFTLDSTKEGADHFHSVDPNMLRSLISDIELFTKMRGNRQSLSDRPDRRFSQEYRRGLYSAKALKKGAPLTGDDVLFCRPVSDLSPNDLERLAGLILNRDIAPHQPLKTEFFHE